MKHKITLFVVISVFCVGSLAVQAKQGGKSDPVVENVISSFRLVDSWANGVTLAAAVGAAGGALTGSSAILASSILALSWMGTLGTIRAGALALNEGTHALKNMARGLWNITHEVAESKGWISPYKVWEKPVEHLVAPSSPLSLQPDNLNHLKNASAIPLITLGGAAAAAWLRKGGQWYNYFENALSSAFSLSGSYGNPATLEGLGIGAIRTLSGAVMGEALRRVFHAGSLLGDKMSEMAIQKRNARAIQEYKSACDTSIKKKVGIEKAKDMKQPIIRRSKKITTL